MAIQSSTDTAARYSTGAIILHWLIALAIAFQLALGFAMPKGPGGFAYYQFHKSVGITILLLSLARLAWRLTHRRPAPLENGLEGMLAKAVHVLLYVFMIGAPLTGWALVSTTPIKVPTLLYGAVPWPHLPLPTSLRGTAEEIHELLAWLGLGLIALHVLGALRHQFLLKDGLLRRIGPGGSALAAGALGVLAVGLYFATGMTIAGSAVAKPGIPSDNSGSPIQSEAGLKPPALDEPSPNPSPEATPTTQPEFEASETAQAPVDTTAPPPVWSIKAGGGLGFTVDNAGETLYGRFSDWSGIIRFDPENPETAAIAIMVDLSSASLGEATQDSMLRGPDFLGIAKATWRSTQVRMTGPGRYSAQGILSLKGASKSQTLTFTLTGEGMTRHVEGSGTIDRLAFGVGSGDAAQDLAEQVALKFAFDATARKP